MANDAITEAYRNPYSTEEEIRKTRAAIQGVRGLSPEEYQKRENEGRSETIAARAAWEASTPEQREKIAGYRINRKHRPRAVKRRGERPDYARD